MRLVRQKSLDYLMARSSRYITFVKFVNKKYRRELKLSEKAVLFYNIDDYLLFLFYDFLNEDVEKYYYKLEEDFMEYSNMQQNIKPRKKINAKS